MSKKFITIFTTNSTMSQKSELQHYVKQTINDLSNQPNFPVNYCNVAAKHLLNILKENGKENVRLQNSYREAWDGHTYVVFTDEDGTDIILDPTYAQYDWDYPEWFIWEDFPDKTLEENRTEQKEWFENWVYDNL